MKTFTKSGLDRFHRMLAGHVERGDVPGMVALLSRGDEIHVEVLGKMAAGKFKPMKRDAIFRIASLSKPIAAVAAMILVEEGKLRLDDSIEPWIPEMRNRRVMKSIGGDPNDTVPAHRAITLRDLLTFRMGFGSVMAEPGKYPIQKLIREYRIGGDGPPRPSTALARNEWIANLSRLPLLAQPGERWMYHVSCDVLGILIERVAERSYGEFLRDRIFAPLAMMDTGFHVPKSKADRIPGSYAFSQQAKKLVAVDEPGEKSEYTAPPGGESAGGGLVSTVHDYFAFSRMMLNKGRLGKERILSRASVELMTSDQLTPANRAGCDIFFGDFSSWGFCMQVDTARREIYHSPGRFGWTGGLGTTAYTDPANDAIAILFTQRMMDSPQPPKVFTDFYTAAYAAME